MVVFIHTEDDRSVLYLMKVIAEGDEQMHFLLSHGENPDDSVDDCCPYVLTVIKGPMTLSSDEFVFLGAQWEGHNLPDFKLDKEVSDKLLTLLREL